MLKSQRIDILINISPYYFNKNFLIMFTYSEFKIQVIIETPRHAGGLLASHGFYP